MSDATQVPVLRQRGSLRRLKVLDALMHGLATSGALLMAALLALLIIVVFVGALPAIQKFGLSFFWIQKWSAVKQQFGATPLIYGTLVTSLIALVIALPISIGSALFLTKLAPKIRIPIPKMTGGVAWIAPRSVVLVASFLIELLAAIPSIAYGLWGVFVLVPFMQDFLQPFFATTADIHQFWSRIGFTGMPLVGHFFDAMHANIGLNMSHWPMIGDYFVNNGVGYNITTAGIILSIMITPIMTAIIRDVIAVAPPELEQGALGLGATWWQATKLVLAYSKMGIFGAVILGFARAIGETMAVTMVIGNSFATDKTLFSQGYTIASLLANQFNNADTAGEVSALIYAALVLLIITTLINGIARVMVMRLTSQARRK